MGKMIVVDIDLTKIDKKRITEKNGRKFYKMVLKEKPQVDSYGNDWMVTENISKEEREAGVKSTILGNAKTLGGSRSRSETPAPSSSDWDI